MELPNFLKSRQSQQERAHNQAVLNAADRLGSQALEQSIENGLTTVSGHIGFAPEGVPKAIFTEEVATVALCALEKRLPSYQGVYEYNAEETMRQNREAETTPPSAHNLHGKRKRDGLCVVLSPASTKN